MTIRYKCDACGAVMKIRDEKAGLQGHCPTCKAVFTVPRPGTDQAPAEASDAQAAATSAKTGQPAGKSRTGKPAAASVKSSTAKQSPAPPPASDDDEFDPVEFLTDSGDSSKAPPKAPPAARTATTPGGKASNTPPAPKPATSDAADNAPGPDDEDFDPVAFLLDDGDKRADASGPKPGAASAAAASPPAARGGIGRPEAPAAPDTPAGRPPERSEAAAAAARATEKLMPGSRAAAEQAAAAAAEGGTVRSAGLPPEKPKRRINWKAVGRDLHRIRFRIITWAVITVGIYLGVSAMLRERIELPPLGQVSGTVTLDGEPLAGARVVFSSIEPTVEARYSRKIRARSATVTTDAQGRYELTYLDDIKGTVLGRNRVQISKLNEKGQEIIPPAYGTESKVLRNVTEGHQVIDIDVKTK